MSILEQKSNENAEVAEEFIDKVTRLNTALSRTYYAVFQKIKSVLIINEDFCSYYKNHPISYKVTDKNGQVFEKDYKLFEHGFMPHVLKYFADYRNQEYDNEKYDEISDEIDFLYNKRRESDYSEKIFFIHTNDTNKMVAKKSLEKMKTIIDFIDAHICE